MLSTIQATVTAQASAAAARPHGGGAATKYAQALAAQAAQFGGAAAAAIRSDAVTPLQPKMRARLFRKPATLLSFFARSTQAAGASGNAVPPKHAPPGRLSKGVKRTSAGKCVGGPGAGAGRGPLQKPEVVDLSADTPVKAAKVVKQEGPARDGAARRLEIDGAGAAGSRPKEDGDASMQCKAEPMTERAAELAAEFQAGPEAAAAPAPSGDTSGLDHQACGGVAPGVAAAGGAASPRGVAAAPAGQPAEPPCERQFSPATEPGSGGAAAGAGTPQPVGGAAAAAAPAADTPVTAGGAAPVPSARLSQRTKAGRLAARRAASAEAEGRESAACAAHAVAGSEASTEDAGAAVLAEKQENGTAPRRAGGPAVVVDAKPPDAKVATPTAPPEAGAAAAPATAENAEPALSPAEQVMALGFGHTEVNIALKICRGNTGRAIEYLLSR